MTRITFLEPPGRSLKSSMTKAPKRRTGRFQQIEQGLTLPRLSQMRSALVAKGQ